MLEWVREVGLVCSDQLKGHMADDTYTHLTAASHLLHCLRLSKSEIKRNKSWGTSLYMHLCLCVFTETFTASESVPIKRICI